jgi:hypothetical protein
MTVPSTAAIVATMNHERYVAEAIASLIDQVDEIVVVDDASTDGTAEVLAAITSPVLTVLRNETRLGVSRSFNRAAEHARSDVLLIQGGDDRSLPDRAARQATALARPGVALTSSRPHVIDGAGRRLPAEVGAEFAIKPAEVPALPFLFFGANYICAPAAAVRRSDFLRLGGFRPGLDLLQDYALWLDLAAEGDIDVDDEPVVEYRKHASNLSREYVGFDAPRQRRLTAEWDHLLGRFLAHAAPDTLDALAQHAGIDQQRWGALDPDRRRTLILLSHPNPLMVRRGLSDLFTIAGDPGGDQALDEMGLGFGDLAAFATRADHRDLGAVARAMSVSRDLDALDRHA